TWVNSGRYQLDSLPLSTGRSANENLFVRY
ncbi:MAG: hypothetical protein ACJAXA_000212, partial [Candidatus Aldehydirespiratoraceae bacterium]